MGLRGSTQQHLTPSIRGKQNGICGKIDAGGYCFQRSHSGVYRSPWCWKRLLKTWCVPFFFKGVSWLIWNSNARIFSLFRGLRTQVFLSNMQIRLYGTCLLRLVIIAQLPKALMHPDSEVDYRVAAGIAGSSEDRWYFTHVDKKEMCGVILVRGCQRGWTELRGLAVQADPPSWSLLAGPGPTPYPHYPPDSLHSSTSSGGTNPDRGRRTKNLPKESKLWIGASALHKHTVPHCRALRKQNIWEISMRGCFMSRTPFALNFFSSNAVQSSFSSQIVIHF